MSQLERVPASRLRPGDVLYACDRKVEVHDVDADELRVRVALSRSPWFSVPLATHFRRVVRSLAYRDGTQDETREEVSDVVIRTVEHTTIEIMVPNPTNWRELQCALSQAQKQLEKHGVDGSFDDSVLVRADEDAIVLWFEVQP